MNFFAKLLFGAALMIAPFVQALELSDLRLPLTRTEADSFTKDYDYVVLSDHSIRRTWRVAGRKIAIDFDNKTDSAICITVTYVEPVPRKEGLADAKILAGDKVDKPKWNQVKSEAAAKFGMKHAEALKLNDGSYLFREVTDDKKKRFTRLSLYAKMPKEDRATLAVLDATGGKTALGSSTVGTAVKELYEDEAARHGSGGVAVAATDAATKQEGESSALVGPRVTALGSTPGARAALRRQQEEAEQEDARNTPAEPAVAKPAEEKKKAAKSLADRTLMEALGLDNPGPVQFGVIGGIVVLLIIIVVSRSNAAKRKAAQKAKFTAVLLNNRKSSAPKVKRH
ncbi:MAG: hypothetical protein IJ985_05850 [Akkermansia sp.]|nr:hypothetical protein [Akkermansia sp.]